MAALVANVTRLGVPLATAVEAASTTPARLLGLHDRGAIEVGRRADVVALDAALSVEMVAVAGRVVSGSGRVASLPVPFAAALSEHPVTAIAIGEVVGQVLERIGPGPDLALLFVTAAHAGALEDAARVVREVLGPTVLIGCASESIAGPAQEVEGTAAVSLWAGHVGLLTPVVLDSVPIDAGLEDVPAGTAGVTGWPESLTFDPKAALLIGDPYTFPMDHFLVALAEVEPGLPVVGGMAIGGRGPGGNRLVLDDRVISRGAVGAFLGPGVGIDASSRRVAARSAIPWS